MFAILRNRGRTYYLTRELRRDGQQVALIIDHVAPLRKSVTETVETLERQRVRERDKIVHLRTLSLGERRCLEASCRGSYRAR
jgi:hypothetical protein